MSSIPVTERYVSRAEISRSLRLSERQISKLIQEGKLADGKEFPSRVAGTRRTFPEERCFDWYIRYKQEEALQRAAGRQEPVDLAVAELRKAVADAEIAELKVQRLRGEVVPVAAVAREWRRTLTRVRARFMATPGEYAPQIMEPLDMARATSLLRGMVEKVLAELQSVGDGAVDTEDAEAA